MSGEKRATKLTLTNLQVRRLAERGYRWVNSVRRLNRAADVLSVDPQRWSAETTDNVHMLAVALQHLDTCVKLLQSGGHKVEGGREFRRAWRSVSFLRGALEHEEDYVVGKGTRRTEVVGATWLELEMSESHLIIWDEDGIVSVDFMGRNYNIRPAILAAIDLEQPMIDLWSPPIELN